ncbi:hypothetical protein FH969_09775 [Miniimonas arenae]|uniref:Carboxypeptidase regulatory-like domain-containing protein n=1 Tax=Miniimonas arenae TaxID=676201 RepID=A0A5C5BBA2_9MICO|nr:MULTISPECIES: hypothetical protein [Miniimonas]TNU73749.1 hypothetical protein FH969_09775 [Miniimonas arenae]
MTTYESDEALFARLALMWQDLDPMPEGLDREMAAVVEAARAAEDLETEYALLTLVAEADAQALGVRAAGAELTVIEFTGRGLDVMLRIAPGRIDGWVAPAAAGTVRLVVPDGEPARGGRPQVPLATASVDADGRFALHDVPAGIALLRFDLEGGLRHETPAFSV